MQSAGRNATDYRRNEASDVPDGPAVQPLEFKLAACRHEGRAARPRVEKGQVDAPLYKHLNPKWRRSVRHGWRHWLGQEFISCAEFVRLKNDPLVSRGLRGGAGKLLDDARAQLRPASLCRSSRRQARVSGHAYRPNFFANGRTKPDVAAQHRGLQSQEFANDQRCALALETGFLAIRFDRGDNASSIDISERSTSPSASLSSM
jgi:hypothetical protein